MVPSNRIHCVALPVKNDTRQRQCEHVDEARDTDGVEETAFLTLTMYCERTSDFISELQHMKLPRRTKEGTLADNLVLIIPCTSFHSRPNSSVYCAGHGADVAVPCSGHGHTVLLLLFHGSASHVAEKSAWLQMGIRTTP